MATKSKTEAEAVPVGVISATAGPLPEPGQVPGEVPFGHFCEVTKGEHKGAYGVFVDVASRDENGYPVMVLVRRRNSGAVIAVPYADLAPAGPGDLTRDRG